MDGHKCFRTKAITEKPFQLLMSDMDSLEVAIRSSVDQPSLRPDIASIRARSSSTLEVSGAKRVKDQC